MSIIWSKIMVHGYHGEPWFASPRELQGDPLAIEKIRAMPPGKPISLAFLYAIYKDAYQEYLDEISVLPMQDAIASVKAFKSHGPIGWAIDNGFQIVLGESDFAIVA